MDYSKIEKRLTLLEDLEEIRKLQQRYMLYLDSLQFDKVIDFFSEDATAEIRNYGIHKGKKEIAELYAAMSVRRKGVKEGHMLIQPDISINGNKAFGTWTVFILFSKPSVQWVQGYSECEYVKENGEWKFQKLKFTRINASKEDMYP